MGALKIFEQSGQIVYCTSAFNVDFEHVFVFEDITGYIFPTYTIPSFILFSDLEVI